MIRYYNHFYTKIGKIVQKILYLYIGLGQGVDSKTNLVY